MTRLINCMAGESLGYPGYFRATYVRGRIDLDAQLRIVVAGVVDRLHDSALALAINDPSPLPSDRSAVLDVRVADGTASHRTVAELVRELDVAPLWGLLPDALSAVNLVSLERIDAKRAYSDNERDAARQRANADADTNDPFGKLERILVVLVVIVVVLAIAFAATKAFRLYKAAA